MKIAYVTPFDAQNIQHHSGTAYFVARTLQDLGAEVRYIGNLKDPHIWWHRLKRKWYALQGKRHLRHREPSILKSYARQVRHQLTSMDVDLIFSPGSAVISQLEGDIPVVFWTDATFAGMVDYYPTYTHLSNATLRSGHKMEQAALERCCLAIYSSAWAARTACENYHIDSARVKVVPFGANITQVPPIKEVQSWIDRRPQALCKLLFMGTEWYRKGGDLALQIATELVQRGVSVELTLVGVAPPEKHLLDFVKSLGFISKATPEGRTRIAQLFTEAHFLVLPTRADCAPMVFAEANAFGTPVITTNVGGIETVVKNGENGLAVPSEVVVKESVAFITSMMGQPDAYRNLARRANKMYRDRLNWQRAGQEVLRLLQGCIS